MNCQSCKQETENLVKWDNEIICIDCTFNKAEEIRKGEGKLQ